MEELNIGEMAKLNCVSTKTLRIYHDMGLLIPRRVDPQTGYRFYDATQCYVVDQIQQLQAMGASLTEIRDAIAEGNSDALANLVQQRRQALNEEINRLKLARHSADEYLASYERYTSPLPTGIVIFRHLPKRYVLDVELEHEPAVPISNESGPNLEAWEVALHLAKRRLIENGVPVELFHNIGWRMDAQDFCQARYRIRGIIVMISAQGLAQQHNARVIPAGEWATIDVRSYLGNNGANSEYAALQQLKAAIKEGGFEADGDCLSEIVFNSPAFFSDYNGGRDALYKLQVPVRVKASGSACSTLP